MTEPRVALTVTVVEATRMTCEACVEQHPVAFSCKGSRALPRARVRGTRRAILTYHSHREKADEVVAEIDALGLTAIVLQLDVGQVESFEGFAHAVAAALQTRWQRKTFDFLVNNGGLQIAEPFGKVTEEAFDRLVDEHLKGVFFLIQRLAPMLADNGAIGNVSSGTTRFYAPDPSIYGAVKGAVEVLTRYLAQDLGARGIRVNTVAPGAVATDFSGGLLRGNERVQKHIASLTALDRFGVAEDVAGAIAALLGDGNRFVTVRGSKFRAGSTCEGPDRAFEEVVFPRRHRKVVAG